MSSHARLWAVAPLSATIVAVFVNTVDSTAATDAKETGTNQFWWRYPDADCGYDDVPGQSPGHGGCQGSTVDECKAMCLSKAGCGGFNYPHGVLKKTDCLSHKAPEGSVDLYVLESSPQPPPPPPPWGWLWPIPRTYSFEHSGHLSVGPTFRITTTVDSPRLARAITRYSAIINASVASSLGGEMSASSNVLSSHYVKPRTVVQHPVEQAVRVDTRRTKDVLRGQNGRTAVLSSLSVMVDSPSEDLPGISTDYSYTLTVASSPTPTAVVRASSVYGAIYGMETFSQLVEAGGLINASGVTVSDSPSFEHRSFMVDTGRRFWPVKTVLTLLDAMAALKMNVLHLHLSDNCRYALDSKMFPRLTERLTGILAGSYSFSDIAEIVTYAADRGVRVIPEADLPGHSQGMQGLSGAGLVFCDTNTTSVKAFADLRADADGQTVATVSDMYSELASVFPGTELFIGADEVSPNGPCTLKDYETIERNLTEYITGPVVNRSVGGWEEYAFETNIAVTHSDKWWVNAWHYHTQAESTARGFRTVASNDSHFYLLYQQPASAYWVDIASGLNISQRELLLGGSVSAWGDEYCYIAYCIHPGQYPSAHALFPPSADDLFHQSILGYSFPRTAAAAGSFWNYVASVDSASTEFQTSYTAANNRLIARGVPSCPTECHCDASSRCGKPYAPASTEPTLSREDLFALHPDESRREAAVEYFATLRR